MVSTHNEQINYGKLNLHLRSFGAGGLAVLSVAALLWAWLWTEADDKITMAQSQLKVLAIVNLSKRKQKQMPKNY